MTRNLKLSLILLLAILISGCEVIVEPGGPNPPIDDLDIYNASYQTNYGYEDESYICDNAYTTLTYRFDYNGDLWGWYSYLQGVETGHIEGRAYFTPNDPNVHYGYNHVEVTYTIPPYSAPLSTQPDSISPQSIIVVPNPDIIGYSRLYLSIDGSDRIIDLISHNIPVINC